MTGPTRILQVAAIDVCYATHDGVLRALDQVSFELHAGETLGIVGESGCGKSTLGRAVLALVKVSQGQVLWLGQNLADVRRQTLQSLRRDLQIVFQDPLASLDPRLTIAASIAEPLQIHEPQLPPAAIRERTLHMLTRVGLRADLGERYPHELSGGQCQRVGIARAMILRPRLVVCDEPVSALDVSVQGQIVNLLQDLQREFGMALIFISHNLAVVRRLSQRILVMYLGRVVESGPADALLAAPQHPYTHALLAAVPGTNPQGRPRGGPARLRGDLPSPLSPPGGCAFHTRCPAMRPRCTAERQELEASGEGRAVACWRWREL